MKIIALKGRNGSGKSTVATMLSQKLTEKGINNKVLAFADPLKKIATHNIDWEDREQKELNRGLLESWAKTIKSIFSFNPFFSQVYKDIQDFQLNELFGSEKDKFVAIISDLRFKSEYECFPALQTLGKVIVIEIKNPLTDNNPPEYELDSIPSNKIINFDSSLEEQLKQFLETII